MCVFSFEGLTEKSKGNERYIDLLPGGAGRLDRIRQEKLKRFRESITHKLSSNENDELKFEDNRTILNLPWKDNGDFHADDSDYQRYLRTLNASIFLRIKSIHERMIDHSILNQLTSTEQSLYNEVLVHLHSYSKISSSSCLGFDHFLENNSSFKQWLNSANTIEHYPYLIFGSRVSGKTLLSTKIVQYLLNTVGKNVQCIVRYFNLTSKSRHIAEIFTSICTQMSSFPQALSFEESNPVDYYQSMLMHFSETQKPFILMIDGIEEMLPQSLHASSLTFYQTLLQVLPPKVSMIEIRMKMRLTLFFPRGLCHSIGQSMFTFNIDNGSSDY